MCVKKDKAVYDLTYAGIVEGIYLSYNRVVICYEAQTLQNNKDEGSLPQEITPVKMQVALPFQQGSNVFGKYHAGDNIVVRFRHDYADEIHGNGSSKNSKTASCYVRMFNKKRQFKAFAY